MSEGPKDDDFDPADVPPAVTKPSKQRTEQAEDDMTRSQVRAHGQAIGTLEQRIDAIQEEMAHRGRTIEALRRIVRRILKHLKTNG